MIKTLLVTILAAAIAEQADLVFRDGGNSCTIFKTEGTRTVHSQCDFHSPNVDAEVQDLKERMTRVEAALPATPGPTENPTKNPTKSFVPWQASCTSSANCAGKGEATVTTIAGGATKGFADGTDCAASFYSPAGIDFSPDGSTLAVCDSSNHAMRLIKLATGEVTTLVGTGFGFADGTGSAASFQDPFSLSYSPDGSALAVADTYNNLVRLMNVATGAVTTLAGSGSRGFAVGTGSGASFNRPKGVDWSPDGITVAVADTENHRVRLINVATGAVTTLAGSSSGSFADGTGSGASLNWPAGLSYSPDGSTLAVADSVNNRVRLINVATGAVTTLAGSGSLSFADGTGSGASFAHPLDVDWSPDGSTIAVADFTNNRVRQINVATKAVTTLSHLPVRVRYVAYSLDGSTVAVDTDSNFVREICTGI